MQAKVGAGCIADLMGRVVTRTYKSRALQGRTYKDGPENIFLHKWTSQKKQNKKVDEPLIFLARPYMRPPVRT